LTTAGDGRAARLGHAPKKAKSFKSFLDEAFGFIDKCGAKPRIFNQNQSQHHQKRLFSFDVD